MSTNREARELLMKARQTITPKGSWCVGMRDNGAGAHCALGALDVHSGKMVGSLANPATKDRAAAEDALAFVICQSGYASRYVERYASNPDELRKLTIAGHNNSHDQAAVLEVFDRAVRHLEVQERAPVE